MKSNTFTIKEIKPNIFHLIFTNQYDMCMFFLRYQEFYESPSPKFRNYSFTILDFIRYYSNAFGNGAFTYPKDWSGFNYPTEIIQQVHNSHIKDPNSYDAEMLSLYKHIKKSSSNPSYIIGSLKNQQSTINHELAHAFFYLNSSYKKTTSSLVKSIPKPILFKFKTYLKSIGYTPKVFIDEIQAYLSTTPEQLTTSLLTAKQSISIKPIINSLKSNLSKYC